jgi:membrane protease YdiL (CAAX protease family)
MLNFASSPLIASIILGASLVAPITEESAVRGYLQSFLEREFAPSIAVVLSSVVFAVAHVTQSLIVAKVRIVFPRGGHVLDVGVSRPLNSACDFRAICSRRPTG